VVRENYVVVLSIVRVLRGDVRPRGIYGISPIMNEEFMIGSAAPPRTAVGRRRAALRRAETGTLLDGVLAAT